MWSVLLRPNHLAESWPSQHPKTSRSLKYIEHTGKTPCSILSTLACKQVDSLQTGKHTGWCTSLMSSTRTQWTCRQRERERQTGDGTSRVNANANAKWLCNTLLPKRCSELDSVASFTHSHLIEEAAVEGVKLLTHPHTSDSCTSLKLRLLQVRIYCLLF